MWNPSHCSPRAKFPGLWPEGKPVRRHQLYYLRSDMLDGCVLYRHQISKKNLAAREAHERAILHGVRSVSRYYYCDVLSVRKGAR